MAKRSTPQQADDVRRLARDVQADIIDIGVSEDEQLAVTAGQAVSAFVLGVRKFFLAARELEQTALATLAEAKRLTVPTSGAGDVDLQGFIKRTSLETKAVEEHWTITTIVHGFHRRLTAKRAIATDALTTANDIGNRLHNAYVATERQRAVYEQRRLDREAEERQQRIRDEELAALEAQAVKAEEGSSKLSEREQAFVDLYCSNGGNGTRAAQMTGFKDPMKAAARLLTLPKIQQAIKAKKEAAAIRQQAAAVKQQPLDVVSQEEARPDIQRAAGASERTTWSARVTDPALFIDAICSGKYGLDRSVLLIVSQAEANKLAQSMHELLNRIPGVQAVSNTKVI